jgi:hypothetical protein
MGFQMKHEEHEEGGRDVARRVGRMVARQVFEALGQMRARGEPGRLEVTVKLDYAPPNNLDTLIVAKLIDPDEHAAMMEVIAAN